MLEAWMQEQKPTNPVDHPILNSPFEYPRHHWRLDNRFRAVDKLEDGRRPSGAYHSVPAVGRKAYLKRGSAETTEPHPRINWIRECVEDWRKDGYPGTTRATHDLLTYWASPDAEMRPFFCQRDSVETLIWLLEAGGKHMPEVHREVSEEMASINREYNEGLARLAVKMATGTGKTRVMAMIILWQALNSERRSDFLVIAPNLTVKDRLRELDPEETTSLYRELLPPSRSLPTGSMRVTVLNFQAFQRQNRLAVDGEDDIASGIVRKLILGHRKDEPESWQESESAMLRRLLKRHDGADSLVVLNDEAHHCYRRFSQQPRGKREEEAFEEQAGLWFGALQVLNNQGRLGQVIDLSATPMFLRKPPNLTYELFPWTVSDYPLIDAVEAGLTKIPRVPVDDDSNDPVPKYRNTYEKTYPKALTPKLQQVFLRELFERMHGDYLELTSHYRNAAEQSVGDVKAVTPVFTVVANNIKNATAIYQYLSGYMNDDGTWVKGALEAFSNVEDVHGVLQPAISPKTILVHSKLDEPDSGGTTTNSIVELQRVYLGMTEDATKAEVKERIRRIFNTVGKDGEPGEYIRCIVSVSMLTEGWDAQTVTHIFGYRKFDSQLLCEQVAGRALRRTSYSLANDELPKPEYARIFGVPFNFMVSGEDIPPPPPRDSWPVFTLPNRNSFRITFPSLVGYRLRPPEQRCKINYDLVKPYCVSNSYDPSTTVSEGAVGESNILETGPSREMSVLYLIASEAVQHFICDHKMNKILLRRRALFSSMLEATREWLKHPLVECTNILRLARAPYVVEVPQLIARSCIPVEDSQSSILPIYSDEIDTGQQRYLDTSEVSFNTRLANRYPSERHYTSEHSEINAAACHSYSEVKLAEALDAHHMISSWVRNFHLGWYIPYFDPTTGHSRRYEPDFIAVMKVADYAPINLLIEFKGLPGPDSDVKTMYTKDWWIPAVNGVLDPDSPRNWEYVFIEGGDDILRSLDKKLMFLVQARMSSKEEYGHGH